MTKRTRAGIMVTLAMVTMVGLSLMTTAAAQAYLSRGASKAERAAIVQDAKRTEVGWSG